MIKIWKLFKESILWGFKKNNKEAEPENEGNKTKTEEYNKNRSFNKNSSIPNKL